MNYKKLEQLIEQNNTNINQVANAVGIAATTLYAWRNGEYTPKIEKISLLANHFNVPIDYFWGDE